MECKPHDDPDKCSTTSTNDESIQEILDELKKIEKKHKTNALYLLGHVIIYILFFLDYFFASHNKIQTCAFWGVIALFQIWTLLITKLK